MAEIKNTFIKSKMNKDLDDRLIPKGEYRNAQNISVSKSEASDVGAVENILGNILSTDFGLATGSDAICNLEVIGYYMDNQSNRIFIMLTNFTDVSPSKLDNHAASAAGSQCFIYVYYIDTAYSKKLVGGSFLNFSTTHPIYGINLLENLLFWTDDRNQPRKININFAESNDSYYTSEDNISVAKYYPWKTIDLYKNISGTRVSTMKDVVSDYLPPLSSSLVANPNKDENWPGDPKFLKDKFVRFSYRFKYEDGEYSLIAPFTQAAFVPKQDGYFARNSFANNDQFRTYKSTEVILMENKINDITLILNSPDNTQWDTLYSNLKVVEVDILYKESNSLSIKVIDTVKKETFGLTESTQLEYSYQSKKPWKTLPERETTRVSDRVPIRALAQEIASNRVIYGNFIDKHTPPTELSYTVSASKKDSETAVTPSYIRKEYQNHTLKQNRTYQVGIVLSDRYGRQSSVILSSFDSSTSSTDKGSTIYHPYKSDGFSTFTGGSNELISATDTWPGDSLKVNFLNTISSYKSEITGEPGLYNATTNPLGWYTFKVVVKQQEQDYYNIYFPGILNGYINVEGVIGSEWAADVDDPVCHIALHGDNINKIPRDLGAVGPGQTLFRSKKITRGYAYNDLDDAEKAHWDKWWADKLASGDDESELLQEYGSLLRMQRETVIKDFRERAENRLSAKVDAGTSPNSSVKLFGRVVNTTDTDNKQWYPTNVLVTGGNYNVGTVANSDTVVTIGKGTDLGLWDPDAWATDTTPEFYNYKEEPLIARLEVYDHNIGVASPTSGAMKPVLSVYETEPSVSKLDLFWETSTSGLIGSLNTSILSSDTSLETSPGQSFSAINFTLDESMSSGDVITSSFAAKNSAGTVLTGATMAIISVKDSANADRTSEFTLQNMTGGYYRIKTASTFWWGADWNTRVFQFTIRVTNSTSVNDITFIGGLDNKVPIFSAPGEPYTASLVVQYTSSSTINVNGVAKAIDQMYTLTGTNGSADSSGNANELDWNIVSQERTSAVAGAVNEFFLGSPGTSKGSRYLGINYGADPGTYSVTVSLKDGGGSGLSATSNAVFTVTVLN